MWENDLFCCQQWRLVNNSWQETKKYSTDVPTTCIQRRLFERHPQNSSPSTHRKLFFYFSCILVHLAPFFFCREVCTWEAATHERELEWQWKVWVCAENARQDGGLGPICDDRFGMCACFWSWQRVTWRQLERWQIVQYAGAGVYTCAHTDTHAL